MKRAIYIWQQSDWPRFCWKEQQVTPRLVEVRYAQGRLLGRINALGLDAQHKAMLDAMTDEVAMSSEIEGIHIDADEVRSSVARHLGIETEGLPEADHYVEGVVQVLMDAVQHAEEPLTAERLFDWHAALFPTGRSGAWRIVVGDWRQSEEPMQVVSGAMGKERVHYEAPPSADIPHMAETFLSWFNDVQSIDPIVKAAIAHLWFVSLHPFEDGNGRITRTLTDMLMARADGLPHRFYSLSAAILRNKKSYYEILESTQHGSMNITAWVLWFLDRVAEAISQTNETIDLVLEKTRFWERHRDVTMNLRQQRMVNKLLDGFEGKLNTTKWARICKCSQDTALRDIQSLIDKGVMRKTDEGGRSTHYELCL